MNQLKIIIFLLCISVVGSSISQIDANLNTRNKRCFDKSVERIGQRFVDWECGTSDLIINCNEKLESDPGSNMVLHSKSGQPFTGTCETCHMNGIRERVVQFNNGRVHGTDTTIYESGCVQVVRNHIDGVENGRWTYYNDSSGLEAWTINYFNGEKHGMSIYYRHYMIGTDKLDIKIGNATRTHTYGLYDSDTLRIEYYKMGKLDGKRTEYFPGSKVEKEVNYKEGLLHGPFVIYNKKGIVLQDLNYFQGQKDGVCQYYYEEGSLLKVENWSKGVKAGEFKTFYIQGHLQIKESYNKKGQRHGDFEERFPNDKVKRTAIYRKDNLVEEHIFDEYGNEIRTVGVEKPASGDEDDKVPTAAKKTKKWWQFWKKK